MQHHIDNDGAVPTYLITGKKSSITTSAYSTDLITRHAGQGNHFTFKKPLGISNRVSHKTGWFHMICVDHRKVNAVTRKDAYPIPRVDDTLDTLSGSTWFTTIDLRSDYWQVEMASVNREKLCSAVKEAYLN